MFQKYALFPHLDVFENIAFGSVSYTHQMCIRDRALSPARIREQEVEGETAQEMHEALDLVAEERPPKAG